MHGATEPQAPGRRADARRNIIAIVQAATAALARDPRASMQDVADACGLHRATVHRHFASRDDLLIAVRDHTFGLAEQTRDAIFADERDPVRAVTRYVTAMVDLGDESRIYRFMPIVDGRNDGPRRVASAAPVAEVLRAGQAQGAFRLDLEAAELATALSGLIATVLPEIATERMTRERGVAVCTQLLLA